MKSLALKTLKIAGFISAIGLVNFAQAATYALYPGQDIAANKPAYWSNQTNVTANQVSLQWNALINNVKSANIISVTTGQSCDLSATYLATTNISKVSLVILNCTNPPTTINVGSIPAHYYYVGPGQNCSVAAIADFPQ